jgi:dihydrofolate reductase
LHRPEIVLIAALAENNRVIGYRGQLPWHFPEDLRRFRQLTLGHSVIVGRVTWEQDLQGQPLLQRRNLVVSRSGCGLPPLEVGYVHSIQSPSESIHLVQPTAAPDASNTVADFLWYEVLPVYSLEQAWATVQGEERVFVIGGASLYQQALPLADRLELTIVQGKYVGDRFFPDYQKLVQEQFTLTQRSERSQYRFDTYIRR